MQRLRLWVYIVLLMVAIHLSACSDRAISSNSSTQQQQTPLPTVNFAPDKVAIGQTVYVPIYSHIYHFNSQGHRMNLSATLSIRNTDLNHPLILTSVRYYDTEGRLLRQDVERPVALKPMASTSFFVAADDTSGGAGANFIVEWVAEIPISAPVIEAVMINSSAGQGISFLSPGRVIKQYSKKN